MSNEQRTAIYGIVTALLLTGGTFGLITAEEAEAYSVSALAILGAVSNLLAAVKTWKQRGGSTKATFTVENGADLAAMLRELQRRGDLI